MPDSVEKILLIALGWLFGLLGPAFVNAINQKREDKACRTAIFSELKLLARVLTLAISSIRMYKANITDDHLHWAIKQLKRFSYPEDRKMLETLTQILEIPFDQRNSALMQKRKPTDGLGLQKYPVPVLDSRVAAPYTFKTTEQVALLSIRTHLGFLDDAVDRVRKFSDMTFQKHEGENYKLLRENVDTALDDYARYAMQIVDRITDAIEAQRQSDVLTSSPF